MFTVTMLPAAQGDAIWIEYGDPRRPYRVLIDAGPPATYATIRARIAALPEDQRHFELFIVSHLDNDHIGAATQLLEERPHGVQFGDVWFNGYRHLVPAHQDELGFHEAQELTTALVSGSLPWNRTFGGAAAVVPDCGPLPTHTLAGDFKLTLLSPYRAELDALVPKWTAALLKLRRQEPELIDDVAADYLGGRIDVRALAESRFAPDTSEPNGSSIAVLAEYGGKTVIFAADAFPGVIERSLHRLLDGAGERLLVSAFKVCHHGSRRNTSPELAKTLSARRYLFSTDGTQTRHPNPEGIARLLVHGQPDATFFFNYRTEYNRDWDNGALKKEYRYQTQYPRSSGGHTIDMDQDGEQ